MSQENPSPNSYRESRENAKNVWSWDYNPKSYAWYECNTYSFRVHLWHSTLWMKRISTHVQENLREMISRILSTGCWMKITRLPITVSLIRYKDMLPLNSPCFYGIKTKTHGIKAMQVEILFRYYFKHFLKHWYKGEGGGWFANRPYLQLKAKLNYELLTVQLNLIKSKTL